MELKKNVDPNETARSALSKAIHCSVDLNIFFSKSVCQPKSILIRILDTWVKGTVCSNGDCTMTEMPVMPICG